VLNKFNKCSHLAQETHTVDTAPFYNVWPLTAKEREPQVKFYLFGLILRLAFKNVNIQDHPSMS
jgi:hypothetical protein